MSTTCLPESVPDIYREVLEGPPEDVLTLAQAGRFLRLSTSAIYKLIIHGKRLRDRTRFRLEAVLVSGRWQTTKAAIERYLRRVTTDAIDA